MELRGCSQLCSIAVIRGGEVIKIPNLARGNPKLKLKNIEEIYSFSDLKCPPKAERSVAMPSGSVEVNNVVKIECTEEQNELDFGALTLRQIRNTFKSRKRKASRSVNFTTVKQEDNDLLHEADVLDLKETLSSWKRKVFLNKKVKKKGIDKCNPMSATTNSNGVRLKDTSFNVGLHDISSNICKPLIIKVEDAEDDHPQPQARSLALSDDPSNITRDSVQAIKYCCPDQDLNTTSGYLQSGNLDQLSHRDFIQSVGNSICVLSQVSSEHLDCVKLQNLLVTGNSEIKEIMKVDDLVVIGNQPLVSRGSGARKEEDELQNSLVTGYLDIEEIMKVDDSVVIDNQPLVSRGSEAREEEDVTDLMACDEPAGTVLNECDSSDSQIHYPRYPCPLQPPLDGNASSKVHTSMMVPNNYCQNPEITNHGEAIESMDDFNDFEKVLITDANCNSMVNIDKNLLPVSGMVSLDNKLTTVEDQPVIDSTTKGVPVSLLRQNSDRNIKSYCHNVEFFNNGTATKSMEDSSDPEAKLINKDYKNCNIAVKDEEPLHMSSSVEALHIVKPVVEGKPSSMLDNVVFSSICSPDIQPCNANDQQIGSEATEGQCRNKLEQPPPEKLFSARKTISPDSKERLRMAMNCAGMQDDTQTLFCGEKLCFEKNGVDTLTSRSNFKKARIILRSKRLEASCETEIGANNKQTLKKVKSEGKHSLIKGNVKGPRASPLPARTAITCSSSQSCSQNAITFSQQQMIDTERLAMKLLTEVRSMKEMVVDTLTCSTAKNNVDKARVAVENVKKVEESTKRMLSIMSRDCNRFCKIMEVIETNGARASPVKSDDEHVPDSEICQDSPISETKQDERKLSPPKSTVHKERKIMFADEAGESLCQVRVL